MYVLSKVKSHSKFQISQTFKLFNSKKLKYSRTQILKYSNTQELTLIGDLIDFFFLSGIF